MECLSGGGNEGSSVEEEAKHRQVIVGFPTNFLR
jgi:hypothetical protein